MEVWVRVLGLRRLPVGAIKGPVRIQAILSEERKETGDSVRGTQSQELVWLKTPSSTLTWAVSEAELQRLKSYSPKFKCYVHNGEEVIAWCMLDVRDLVNGSLREAQWVKLQGTGAGGELRLSGGARWSGRRGDGGEEQALAVEGGGAAGGGVRHVDDDNDGGREERGPDALPIGEGTDYFLLTIELARWGGDGRGLLLPGPAGAPMWLSYVLFGAVARTDGFDDLGAASHARRSVDMFRLRSRRDGSELVAWFSKHQWLEIYLCTANRVIAVGKLDLWGTALGGKGPREVNEAFFPHETEERIVMESWETEGPPGIKGGAWVDVRVKLERADGGGGGARQEGIVPVEAEKEEEEAEKERHQPRREPVPTTKKVEERGALELLEAGNAAGQNQEGEHGGDGGDEAYSDDFEGDGGGGKTGPSTRTAESAGREGRRAPQQRAEDGGGKGGRQLSSGRVEYDQEDEEEEDEEEEDEGDDDEGGDTDRGGLSTAASPAGPPSPPPPKPSGPRRFRLSVDLRSVRDLAHSQHVFLFYHYPHLVPPPSVLDNPVLSHPVWVPAYLETVMDKSCCTMTFTSTFDALQRTAEAYPFIVSVRAKEGGEGGGGGGFEFGKAALPFAELIGSAPINCRCPGRPPRVYRTYQACERRIQKLASRGEVAADACPVTVYAMDRYTPIVGREGIGGGSGIIPSLHVVLVLEDMGPVPTEEWRGPGSAEESPQSVHMPRLQPPAPPQPSAGDVSAAMGMLELERRKIEFEDWRHRRVGVVVGQRSTEVVIDGMHVAGHHVVEVEWGEKLRAKEAARMEELERAFVEREKDRKATFAKAQEDFSRLEAKLRKSLADVEARERRLATYEEEVKAESSKRAVEVQALQRRLRDDAKHQVDMEKHKAKEAEDRAARLEKALASLEKKHEDIQEEYSKYRKDQRRSSATVLNAEIAKLKGEKAELEARCEREKAEKNKALLEKEQYRSALQRTARALKREQGRHMANVRQELEQLKIEYLAREERFRLDGERDELRTIKKELDAMRHLSLNMHNVGLGMSNTAVPGPPGVNPPGMMVGNDKENLGVAFPPPHSQWLHSSKDSLGFGGAAVHHASTIMGGEASESSAPPKRRAVTRRADASGAQEEEEDPELSRLRAEREDLLSTGVYSVDDPIIQELWRLIAEKEEGGGEQQKQHQRGGGADPYYFSLADSPPKGGGGWDLG